VEVTERNLRRRLEARAELGGQGLRASPLESLTTNSGSMEISFSGLVLALGMRESQMI
jgi:hypothetical protein